MKLIFTAARAMLKDANVILLDEATSAVSIISHALPETRLTQLTLADSLTLGPRG